MKRWLWLLLIPLALGLARLRFDVEVLNLLPRELPVVHGLQLYQRHFASANELLVTLEAPDTERAETAARSLAEHLRTATNFVVAAHWQPPWLEQPELAAELAAVTWLNQPPAVFAELTNQLVNPAATLAATRERLATSFSPEEIARASFDPFGLTQLPASVSAPASFGRGDGMFASADGTFRLLFVKPRGALATYPECAAWLDSLRAHTVTWQQGNATSGITLHFTGRPVFVAEIASRMERDMQNSVLGTLGIIAVLFWWVHRRWRPLLWLLALLTLTLAGTLALGGLVIGTLNVFEAARDAGVVRRLGDGSLVHAVTKLPAVGREIARELASLEKGLQWSALAVDALPFVTELGLHKRLSPADVTGAQLRRLIALDDRTATTRLAGIPRSARDTLMELPDRELKALARALGEPELQSLSSYLTGLEPQARDRVMKSSAAAPPRMQALAPARVREAILASRDQLAAVSMMLRSDQGLDVKVFKDDLLLVYDGRVSPILLVDKHPAGLGGIVVGLLMLLLVARRLVFGRRGKVVAAKAV